jgi:hypothetical protein
MPELVGSQLRDLGVPAQSAPLLLSLDSPAFVDEQGATFELIITDSRLPSVMCDVRGFVAPGNSSGIIYVLPKLDVVKPGVMVAVGTQLTSSCNAGFELVAGAME